MNEQHHIEPELTVGEIIKLYLSHWRMFVLFSAILFSASLMIYIFKVPYVASSKIVIHDTQNSSLQAFSSQYFGLSKTVQDSKKGSSLLSKHIEYLKTREFYELLLKRIEVRGNSALITMEERRGYEVLKDSYLKNLKTDEERVDFLQKLDRWTKIDVDSEFEIKVTSITLTRPVSMFLANTISELAVETLKQRELNELSRVEGFMQEQKLDSEQKLAQFGRQLTEMQNKDGNIFPLVSQDKIGDYLSELLVRSNEIKLKIAENKKTIEYLESGRTGQRESALYGLGGKIESLKIENKLLAEKYGQLQASIDQIKKDAKVLPIAAQRVEDLKKKSEFEFSRFKELSSALTKLEAQKVSVDTRFEVLESARWENTLPQIGLVSLGLVSLILSQVVGSLTIYFKYLWNPHVVTAQASRKLVIFDSNSADPRVVFENAKVKLSLKKTEKKNEPEQGAEQASVAWNVLNVGQGTDITQ